ncbi:hypothetical protein BT96DRAFT_915105 [Gymnopus androsaceus JB14]|uniref:F-box domain-containing protein n=1 Tax=Gymnopus androsaceus JB14 TaxID=1447944 RepID=A0A6A4I443_9AGAR|nr:hypothetical protein BT96DRAFT_915105 [Gymnopus androsaceus JB14]
MPTLGEFRDIITTSPELERLSIVGWGPRLLDASGGTSSQENVLPRVMIIPKLTKFCFGFVDVEYAVKLLSLFNLPSLQKLELEDVAAIVDPMGSSDASAILAPFGGSFFYPLHQVECLDLRSIRSNSEMAFINFFRCLSSLKDLSLMDIDSTLLSSLGPPSNLSMPYPLPQLVHLVCRRLDAKTLAAVLSARAEYAARSGLQPLQSVQFELDRSDVDNGLSSVLSDEDRNALMNTGVELMIHLNDV